MIIFWLPRESITKQKRAGSTKSWHFFFQVSFDTFHSSDNEVCICTALKCPWVVLGFKVPGHQTQQAHQQRLLQSGIWQRQNGSNVSVGAASRYCGNLPLFVFVFYCRYCSVCLPIYKCSDYCNISSDRTGSGRFAAKYFSFLFDCSTQNRFPSENVAIRFKEMFFTEATALFVLRKYFHHEAKLTFPHICLPENSVRWNKFTLCYGTFSAKPRNNSFAWNSTRLQHAW